jgi:hypothetical protein
MHSSTQFVSASKYGSDFVPISVPIFVPIKVKDGIGRNLPDGRKARKIA